jgi:urea transport system permease protein
MLARIAGIQSKGAWLAFAAAAVLVLAVVPAFNGLVPASAHLHLPDYLVPLLGKFLCYALVALAMDMIWGFAGILSLGHGVFFALGGYAMGMHLMRSMAGEGVYRSQLPDFMVFLDWKALPWFWQGFDQFWFAALVILFLPALAALVFGFFAFRSRIKGVYFSIITQATTYALMLLFFRNETGLGGNNGLTDFKRLLGYPLSLASTKLGLYMVTALVLLISFLACRYIITSKLGRLLCAIRDAESRLLFLGYDVLRYKLFVWTFSAFLCGLAGALYVPQAGIINPGELHPANSIEMAVWVAVGGRGSLVGGLLGAFLVNGAKSWFTVAWPELWLFFLAALFIGTTMFLPQGLVGLRNLLPRAKRGGTVEEDKP